MRTGFYEQAYRYGVSAESLLEEEETLHEIFEHPEDLMISPETYLHGTCDMFAWFLAREYDYGIRAYHTEKQGYQDLLVHAVCFCDNIDGSRSWIDIRGITDDEDEMLEPFLADIDQFNSRGLDVSFKDYPRLSGLSEFVADFVDPTRDLSAFEGELSGLLAEEMLGIYEI